ncbi:MAG: hypothetical protein PHO14_09805 [Kiritimatiellae bacterium]|jgi:hypothetical protein|nr:hypothetical protein [Kiritimatiellia bacterium]MDD4342506.1 hypothetical protein [Kiritimatiellia bacterium]MDY0149429.1 hypothetical protein [Kiritimatiellia bacterium]
MKKLLACFMIVLLVLLAVAPAASAAGSGRGGFMGFIAGCCFGIRAGSAYNDGKEVHWREWCSLIPYVNIVFAIWNGIDGANGVTSSELAAQYGAIYY